MRFLVGFRLLQRGELELALGQDQVVLNRCTSPLRSFRCHGIACTPTLLLMSNGPAHPESDLDPTDPYAREAQTFPRLSEEMAARVVAYGTEERLPKGTLVFERGELGRPFVSCPMSTCRARTSAPAPPPPPGWRCRAERRRNRA
jgi:hypothetical protein